MNTVEDLQNMARFISVYGLHRGDQFAHLGPVITLDISALAYTVTEHQVPDVFFTDEGTARDLIESSEPAMACIRAISGAIANYQVPDTAGQPDLIEHVSQWTFTPPIGEQQPPTDDEVIGCILRAANHLAAHTPTTSAA